MEKFKFKIGDVIEHRGRKRKIETAKKNKYGNIFYSFEEYIEGAYQSDLKI